MKRVVETYWDDLDPTQEADERLFFTFDNESYAIDLTSEHVKELRDLLAPYLAAGPPTRFKAPGPPPNASTEWFKIADEARSQPGKWIEVAGSYTVQQAGGRAHAIKNGTLAAFRPPGSFDAKQENGGIFLRYRGDDQ
jgi:hypothetical protein